MKDFAAQLPARYQQLGALLEAGKWLEADEETAKVMLEVANRTEEGFLDEASIDNFPGEDLRAIDVLWVKHSKGRIWLSQCRSAFTRAWGERQTMMNRLGTTLAIR